MLLSGVSGGLHLSRYKFAGGDRPASHFPFHVPLTPGTVSGARALPCMLLACEGFRPQRSGSFCVGLLFTP